MPSPRRSVHADDRLLGRPARWLPWLLGLLLVVTGMTSLCIEQILERLLGTVVGASTPAGAIVLAVYFAGLSLGGLLYGRLTRRFPNPLLLYGSLEGVVGAYALVLSTCFAWVQSASARVVHLGGNLPLAVFLLRLGVACVWILPPAVAMGATYASVVGALRWVGVARPERVMTWLYAANLAGAVVGAAMGPYLLFPWLGMTGTLAALAAAQAAVLVAVVVAQRRAVHHGERLRVPVDVVRQATGMVRTIVALVRMRSGPAMLAYAALSGFVVFGFEVLWLHLIGAVLGTSVYAFANMLTVVLLGLFAGGALVSSVAARRPGLGAVLLPIGLLGSSTLLAMTFDLWDDVPSWLLVHGRTVFDFAEGEWLRFRIALLLVGVPSIALGMVYPSIFRHPAFPIGRADQAAGVLGAANAAGSVVGALSVAFLWIPWLGSERTFQAIALLPALAAFGLAGARVLRGRRNGRTVWRSWSPILAAALGAAVGTAPLWGPRWNRLELTSGVNVYFRQAFVRSASKLRFWHEDTAGGITSVVETAAGDKRVRVLLSNGKFQGDDGAERRAQAAVALLPCLVAHGRDRALVIGLGTGHAAQVIASAGFGQVEVAEIAPGIVEAARLEFGALSGGIWDDPRVELFVEDGRNHLLRSVVQYDVISMEVSSVWFAGSSNLYSRQFYELAQAHLAPGGVLQQWIQLHHIALEEVISVLATMRAVFPEVALFLIGEQGIVLGSDRSAAVSVEMVERVESTPALAAELALLGHGSAPSLRALSRRMVLSAEEMTRLADVANDRGIPLTDDENRYLEFTTPRHNLELGRSVAQLTVDLLDAVVPAERNARLRALGLIP